MNRYRKNLQSSNQQAKRATTEERHKGIQLVLECEIPKASF
jgi:hypothetical protein